MTPRRRIATMATAALAAVLTTTGPASAQVQRDDDRGADVDTFDTDASSPQWEDSSRSVNVAVTGARVEHTRTALTGRVSMKDLRRNGDLFYLNVPMRDGAGTTYQLYVTSTKDDPAGEARLTREGVSVDCARLDHTISFADDVIRFAVPRSCLGDPRKISFTGAVIDYPAGAIEGRLHADHLLTDGHEAVWSGFLRRG